MLFSVVATLAAFFPWQFPMIYIDWFEVKRRYAGEGMLW